ncbi:MAG: hypothetical protein ABJB33_03655 [Gemmatimonadota bacterium]
MGLIASPGNGAVVQSVAPRADGGWVTGWNEPLDTLGNVAAYARMLDANGAPSGGQIPIGAGAIPTLAMVEKWSGGWSAIWLERTTPASSSTVKIRFYASGGSPVGNERVVATVDLAGKVPYALANAEGFGRTFIALQFRDPGSSILGGFDHLSNDLRGIWVRP